MSTWRGVWGAPSHRPLASLTVVTSLGSLSLVQGQGGLGTRSRQVLRKADGAMAQRRWNKPRACF